ncbi:MAG: hypothetical protein LM550_16325 [Candidatus Contendobacter sp.]|jgi:hypothetical protein|nr:hypothetical protein [Gammaproteobacteria bacterium]MCC8995213.1 hypothetical protein [Candidatus Contendobacter sp.]
MNDPILSEYPPGASPDHQRAITRIPRAAQARQLQHDPEADPPFMAVLQEVLPDEEARLAYLNHLAWQARS